MKNRNEFAVVECSGTPFEIGRKIGSACKDNIAMALGMVMSGLNMMAGATEDQVIGNALKYLPAAQRFNPELMETLQGQAEGADMSFEQVFTLKCGFDLMGHYPRLSGLCTSFAAAGSATSGGPALLGQTIDWYPGCPLDLVMIKHADGQEQITLILWGIIEYTLNSDGFGMCANGTWAAEEIFRQNLPIGIYMPAVMRQRSLEKARIMLGERARGLGHFLLAGADGQMFGIEGLQNDFAFLAPERDMLAHANHYLTPRFQPYDLQELLVPDSPGRVERMRALMFERHGRIDAPTMMEVFADHDAYPVSICRHVDVSKPPEFASATLAAYVMIPGRRSMWIARGNPCECEFVEYRL